jgi:hypothetical protein
MKPVEPGNGYQRSSVSFSRNGRKIGCFWRLIVLVDRPRPRFRSNECNYNRARSSSAQLPLL